MTIYISLTGRYTHISKSASRKYKNTAFLVISNTEHSVRMMLGNQQE